MTKSGQRTQKMPKPGTKRTFSHLGRSAPRLGPGASNSPKYRRPAFQVPSVSRFVKAPGAQGLGEPLARREIVGAHTAGVSVYVCKREAPSTSAPAQNLGKSPARQESAGAHTSGASAHVCRMGNPPKCPPGTYKRPRTACLCTCVQKRISSQRCMPAQSLERIPCAPTDCGRPHSGRLRRCVPQGISHKGAQVRRGRVPNGSHGQLPAARWLNACQNGCDSTGPAHLPAKRQASERQTLRPEPKGETTI